MPSPYRAILSASIPLLLSMSAGIIASLMGTALLGQRETAALAAFALASAVLNPVTAAVGAGLRGMAPFIAPHRDNPCEALPFLRDARWLSLTLGTMGAAAVLAVPLIAQATAIPAEVAAELGALPLLLALSVLLYGAGGGANGVLIALGQSRQVLWSGLSSAAVEVLLLLVLVPRLGVHGVGLAMVISTAVTVAVSNICLLRLPELRGQSPWPGRPRPQEILNMARVGIPMSAGVLIKFTVLGSLTYIAARLGAQSAAAHAILRSLAEFLALSAFAIRQASAPETARPTTPADLRRINRAATLLSATGVLLSALLLYTPALNLFTSDPAVYASILTLAPLLTAYALTNSCGIIMSSSLTGLQRSSWTLTSSITGYALLAVIATPMTTIWGLTGLWTAMTAAGVVIRSEE